MSDALARLKRITDQETDTEVEVLRQRLEQANENFIEFHNAAVPYVAVQHRWQYVKGTCHHKMADAAKVHGPYLF